MADIPRNDKCNFVAFESRLMRICLGKRRGKDYAEDEDTNSPTTKT